jgi:hypothetical protein
MSSCSMTVATQRVVDYAEKCVRLDLGWRARIIRTIFLDGSTISHGDEFSDMNGWHDVKVLKR